MSSYHLTVLQAEFETLSQRFKESFERTERQAIRSEVHQLLNELFESSQRKRTNE